MSRHVRGLTGKASQLEDMEPGVGAVHRIDVTAVVHLDVVGLDRYFAAIDTVHRDATFVRIRRGRRDIESDLARVEWITNVHRPDARVEPGEEHHAPVVDRREALVRGMVAETA